MEKGSALQTVILYGHHGTEDASRRLSLELCKWLYYTLPGIVSRTSTPAAAA
jgi:hypothetical protein